MLSGKLPLAAKRLVQDWIAQRSAKLAANWARMETGEDMEYIEGL